MYKYPRLGVNILSRIWIRATAFFSWKSEEQPLPAWLQCALQSVIALNGYSLCEGLMTAGACGGLGNGKEGRMERPTCHSTEVRKPDGDQGCPVAQTKDANS
jgi:hypothetical protein